MRDDARYLAYVRERGPPSSWSPPSYNSNGDYRARYAHLVRPDRFWLALESYNFSDDRAAPRAASKTSYPTLTLPQMRAAVLELDARFRSSSPVTPVPSS